MRWSWSRLRLSIAAAGLLLAGCGGVSPQPTQPPAPAGTAVGGQVVPPGTVPECPAAPGPVAGAIVFGFTNNLVAIDPSGANQQQITTVPPSTRVLEPDWSPDGQTLAFVFSYPSASTQAPWLLSSKICGIDRATGQARTIASPPNDTTAFEDVTWASDGKALLTTVHAYSFNDKGELLGETLVASRYDLQSSALTELVSDARAPMLSPDGSQLSYVYQDPATFAYSLMVSDPTGQASRVVTTSVDIQGVINAPRWSADGKDLLFSISSLSGVPGAPGTDPLMTPQPSGGAPSADRRSLLDQLLGVEVASAHGLPADIWVIGADGQNARRVTNVGLDDPRFDWDPAGGRVVYTSGFGGLTMVNLADGSTQRLTDIGDFGGVSWR